MTALEIIPFGTPATRQWRRPSMALWCRFGFLCGLLVVGPFETCAKGQSEIAIEGCESIELSTELLQPVQHRTMRISDAEREAYFQVLHQAGEVSYQKQEECAAKNRIERRNMLPRYRDRPESEFPAFIDLFSNPEWYHGKPTTLSGRIRKLISYPAGPNEFGLTTLYEAWLFTDDSQSNPAVIVSTSIPDGMPLGDRIHEQASVTGYFFKLYGYTAKDATRLAPLILAQRIEWSPATKAETAPAISPFVHVAITLGVLAVVLFVWRNGRRDRAVHRNYVAGTQNASAVAFPSGPSPEDSEVTQLSDTGMTEAADTSEPQASTGSRTPNRNGGSTADQQPPRGRKSAEPGD